MMYDLIFLESGTMRQLFKAENVKVDTALKEFANALAYVSNKGGEGREIEIGVRVHDPRANNPKAG